MAPAGATSTSSAIGPVRTGAGAKDFAPFPMATKWNGLNNADYVMVVKAKTGANPREFAVTAKSSMVFWLSCIGTGTVRLTSPAIKLNWAIPCGNGDDPQGLTYSPPQSTVGKKIKVLVTPPAGGRWEVRIDEPESKTA